MVPKSRIFAFCSIPAVLWAVGGNKQAMPLTDEPFVDQVEIKRKVRPNATEPDKSVTAIRDVVFAEVNGQQLKLDIYLPASDSKPLLVVWVHGGGWRGGSKDRPPLKSLTRYDFAIASISYRFTDKAIFPAQIHDCKAAIRWLRANARKYGYDSDWIAVAGASAGGHLALLLGVSGDVEKLEGNVGGNKDQSSRVQAVIDFFGPSDFVLRGTTQPDRAYSEKSGSFALLGGVESKRVSRNMEEFASPASYVSADDPPLLVFHGDADEVVLLDQSKRIVKLYKKAGIVAQLVVLQEAGHGGKKFFEGANFKKALDFLNQHRPK